MPIVIDGYNLLFSQDDLDEMQRAGKPFRDVRDQLLRRLGELLGERVGETIVVFDAVRSPPGLRRHTKVHGLTVHFANRADGADTMVEEMIRDTRTPDELTVVTGDRQIRDAARRRSVRVVGSERFMADLVEGRDVPQAKPPAEPLEKTEGPTRAEADRWIEEFRDIADDPDARDILGAPGIDPDEIIP